MECVTELATGFVSKIAEKLWELIGAQLGYLIYYDNNINNMKDVLKALQERKQEVQGKVDADKRNGREIVPHVERWLSEVADIEDELRRFHNDEASKNKKCLGGWCPNLNTRFSLGKRAKKTKDKLDILKEEKFEIISNPAPPLKLSSTFAKGFKSIESRKSIIREVIEKLKDEKFTRVSICGMGGVGKTTLVKEVITIVEAEKLFDDVVFAVVSQTPDYGKIQGAIADVLGLKFDKESLQGRASQLLNRIRGKRVLIVLDDVWEELNFETIGLPLNEDDHKASKVIFTSRNERTCRKMGSQKNFNVNILSREESWDLFREITSDDVANNPDIHLIAKEIANECGGLPIAIVTVGKALQGNKEKYFWEDALNQLRKSLGSFSEVEKCIELSYNLVDREKKAKYFLFLCCLFPEDADIPIEVLMREGLGLGLFEDQDALSEVRNQVHTLISNLRRRYLLLDSNKEECVKMHDVVRDVVISIASTKENEFKILCDAEKKGQEKSTWNSSSALSIMIDEVKEWPNNVEFPKLELLQMASTRRQSIPINFLRGTTNLKVLCLQYLCIPKVSSLFSALNNLRMLRLEDCQVGDISVIGKELWSLEILSFVNSNIKEIPIEIGQLGFLRLLDLTGCNDLDKFSSNVLTSLSRLEEFYFRIENFPWMQNSDFSIGLKKISHQLKVVEIRVRKIEELPKDLIFENLERFWVYVAPYAIFNRRGYLESNILQLRAVDYNSIKCSMTFKHLIKRCEILKIEKMKNLKNVIWELEDGAGFPHLKDLKISKCSNLEFLVNEGAEFPCLNNLEISNCSNFVYLVNGSEVQKLKIDLSNLVKLELKALPSLIGFNKANDLNNSHQSMPHFPKLETILLDGCISLEMLFDLQGYSQSNGQSLPVLFPQLKEIHLSQLNKLTHVWGNVSRCVQGFQNLRVLTILKCDSLIHIFTPAIVRAIRELEELTIESCNMLVNLMVESIGDEEDDHKGKEKVETIVFDKLYSLSLSNLPKLDSICAKSYELEWPSLRKLNIDDCPMLKLLVKRDNVGVTSYSNIQDTESSDFKENKSRSFNWSAGCTPLLSKFIHQGSTNKRSSKAVSLAQDHVPSTSEIKSKTEIGHMPVLKDLFVRKCDLLDVLLLLEEKYNPTISSNLKTIRIESCEKLETIVAKREERTDIMNTFAQLESLHLQDLPNLVGFCFSGTYASLDKQDDKDACQGDQKSLRRDPLIDGFLFSNLTSMSINGCNKISILLSPSSLRSLERLQKLEVLNCENIEEIVSQEERETSVNKIMLHGLQHLLFQGLSKLKAFCQGSYNFDFPSLREVRIEGCPNMEVFSGGSSHTPKLEDVNIKIEPHSSNYIHKGDLNATIQGFKAFVTLQKSEMLSLSELHNEYFIKNPKMEIMVFHKLLVLVPFNKIHVFQHLQQLSIRDCDSLLEVFESKEGVDTNKGDTTMHMTHYKLQKMRLYNLPNLRQIWKHNITRLVSFQKLTSIEINLCNNLKSLLSHSMARSLVQLQQLFVENCNTMEEIVTKEDENIKGGSKVKILFPKLKTLLLDNLPMLECFCSRDYDYDLPLCDVGEDKKMNNKQVEISFPELESLYLRNVPKLKCFCSGAYDYDLMLSSSCNEEITEECPQITTFPKATVTVTTPNLPKVWTDAEETTPNHRGRIVVMSYLFGTYRHYIHPHMLTLGDLNLTIYYIKNSEKYKVELQKLETFRCIEQDQYQHLLGYISRRTKLVLNNCNKLLNCIPSNMMHIFQHVIVLEVRQCGSLEEILESEGVGANGYEGDSMMQYKLRRMELDSLPKLKHIWKNHGRVLGFQNLGILTIRGCHDLKYVFPDVSIARSLPSLHSLIVYECNKMEEIIQNNSVQQQQPKEAKFKFPNLFDLTLKKLPSLKCFCSSPCYFELPRCYYITIEECPKMENFCDRTLYTPVLKSLSVDKTKFDIDEDINEIIRIQHHK